MLSVILILNEDDLPNINKDTNPTSG